MTFETAFIFVISLILLWIKPGPGQAAIITRALNDGFWPAFALAFGAMVGNAIYFVVAVLGLGVIQENVAVIGIILKIIGAGYLFYLGYNGLKDINSGKWAGKSDKLTKKDVVKNFSTGLLIELSNPITIFYFVALLPVLMPLTDISEFGIIIGVLLVLYPGMLLYSVIIGLAVQIKETLSNTTFVRNINLITSIGFILIGAFLIFSLITNFDASFAL